ncbi:hypothetical protein [Flavobacterium sp. MK4S-17]|uniref:hypothetical protein n=1 Tax=Flavobacterium sp. MK4S-17 TaxID=2543737 RepID=UPI00135874E7|nr:hypothetical protein [Flavobacterium sp. MK4S-17]
MKKSKPQNKLSLAELIDYPEGSLGFHLGQHLFKNSIEPNPEPESEDIFRALITDKTSDREEIGMYYYLAGNGDYSFRTLFIAVSGGVLMFWNIPYFLKRYNEGKKALRFFDLNHFAMLHLPLTKIKATFLIR